MLRTNVASEQIDDALAATFPASDPPAWNPGMASLIARREQEPAGVHHSLAPASTGTRSDGVIAVSRPLAPERTFGQALLSLAGTALIVLLVPVVILALGTPLALLLRGLLEFANWVVALR